MMYSQHADELVSFVISCTKSFLKKSSTYNYSDKDEDMLEMALIENIQREDLNPIEEAEGYLLLIEKYKLTQEDLSLIHI